MEYKKYNLGVFLDAGGNKAFFCNGIVNVLHRENIKLDKLVGYSSSAGILAASLYKKNQEMMELYVKKLNANSKNFYWLKKKHFPHEEIYGSCVSQSLQDYPAKAFSDFSIISTITSRYLKMFKIIFCTVLLALRVLYKINILKFFRKILGIKEVIMTNSDVSNRDELINFIMASSSVYPFIKPRLMYGKMVMEGGLLDLNFESYFDDCDKKIIIHTEKGITRVADNVMHIYADETIPGNILDLTDGFAIVWLHNLGESVMVKNLSLLKSFMGKKEEVFDQISHSLTYTV